MLYKIDSMGYFGGVSKVSRGPWWRDYLVENDGLDYFYLFRDIDGKKQHLNSSNLSVADREHLQQIYWEMVRTNRVGFFLGGWLGFEVMMHTP